MGSKSVRGETEVGSKLFTIGTIKDACVCVPRLVSIVGIARSTSRLFIHKQTKMYTNIQ